MGLAENHLRKFIIDAGKPHFYKRFMILENHVRLGIIWPRQNSDTACNATYAQLKNLKCFSDFDTAKSKLADILDGLNDSL